jgi:bifunctional DNA-binding transcriptional regulator/antitoxin component of YhaV-PrlF toxin-antitoxin module
MNGKKEVKYYKYPNTSGRVNIPADIGEILNWRSKDSLKVMVKTIDGHTGLFIYKDEEK